MTACRLLCAYVALCIAIDLKNEIYFFAIVMPQGTDLSESEAHLSGLLRFRYTIF